MLDAGAIIRFAKKPLQKLNVPICMVFSLVLAYLYRMDN